MIRLIICLLLTGCSIGVRTETQVVYASIAKTPQEVNGLVRVATNQKIAVTVDGKLTKLDIGGYYIVSASDLQTMLKGLQ